MTAQILVVEDEGIVAKDIQDSLEKLGYGVCGIASSGKEAIHKAAETNPDLILMDIVLQGNMDGVDAVKYILTHRYIPVIYLTAYADDATLQRAKISAPHGYLLKPFKDIELHLT